MQGKAGGARRCRKRVQRDWTRRYRERVQGRWAGRLPPESCQEDPPLNPCFSQELQPPPASQTRGWQREAGPGASPGRTRVSRLKESKQAEAEAEAACFCRGSEQEPRTPEECHAVGVGVGSAGGNFPEHSWAQHPLFWGAANEGRGRQAGSLAWISSWPPHLQAIVRAWVAPSWPGTSGYHSPSCGLPFCCQTPGPSCLSCSGLPGPLQPQ